MIALDDLHPIEHIIKQYYIWLVSSLLSKLHFKI